MPLAPMGSTLRVLRPAPNVLAFYDGRVADTRLWSEAPNWLDDGAYALGIASYAIVEGKEALVYDTHISLAHARLIRRTLEDMGVRHMRVVLSHWHDDHVAGNEVFADCEILANALTADILTEKRAKLESGDPPIRPLVLPNRTFSGEITLQVGVLPVTLRQMDIHSCDGTVALLPDGLLLAGDTVEDPITYVDEPERLAIHLEALAQMARWPLSRILPNHGAAEVIAAGGYQPDLIAATRRYVERLIAARTDPGLAVRDLRAFVPEDFASGAIGYFAPYEAVHRQNLTAVTEAS
ncbi:glyoxylase-like metal-dependent hydrolase (beta-lactamase superfamily II) [Azorhizobium sp. AG788]|uniref:MBL fold metallo-hydrolase n=1 Tax=Azorhizobium sp. AG788 TaxID=2183897 RepID=UPI00105F7FA2|nr:MBL fold metallo-hydrolase [Azorhizobium sp. AG788]TDT94786.1 glyoxylase-like metal-dependent hydrolase (beta-lactamase superfamily II) [Azorhizobium sp. AG788]